MFDELPYKELCVVLGTNNQPRVQGLFGTHTIFDDLIRTLSLYLFFNPPSRFKMVALYSKHSKNYSIQNIRKYVAGNVSMKNEKNRNKHSEKVKIKK